MAEKKEPKEKESKEPKEESFGEQIGKVAHYYTHLGVAVVKVEKGSLKVGDKIRVKGATSDFTQKVESMQMEHESVKEAKKGQSIGLKVVDHAREHDKVYKV